VTIELIPGNDGALRIQFDRGPLTEAPARPSYLRVGAVAVEQPGWPKHGWTRLGLYLLLGLLTGACCYGLFGTGWGSVTTLVLFLALTAPSRLMPLQMAVTPTVVRCRPWPRSRRGGGERKRSRGCPASIPPARAG